MKLSDAIRLGSMLKPQCFDNYQFDGGTCAIGAALDAIGVLDSFDDDGVHFPVLVLSANRCPACDTAGCRSIGGVIAHLNDFHRWTREQIADFIASVEAAQAPAQPASERCGTTAVAQPVLSTRVSA